MDGRYWLILGGRLLVAVIIVGWAASYLFPGGSGEKELQKSLDAMKQVRSVKIALVADPQPTQHSEFSWELVCSQDAVHYTDHLVATSDGRHVEMNIDELHVGYRNYDHQPDGSWALSRNPSSGGTAQGFCNQFPRGDDAHVMPPFGEMIKRGIIDKGDKKTVNGVRCREWKIAMKGGFSGLEHDTVCVGLEDHLPYEWTVDWEHSRATYSDYNSPFQLDIPSAEVQPTSSTN